MGLSTGVKLLEGPSSPGVDIVIHTPDRGGLRFKVQNPAPGPGDPFWVYTSWRAPHPGDRKAFISEWTPPSTTVDFRGLSGPVNETAMDVRGVAYRYPQVFWIGDPEGAYVLMDQETRRLVRVSPLPEVACGHFWQMVGLTDSGDAPDCLVDPREPQPTWWAHPADSVWRAADIGPGRKHELYFCFHPCPSPKDQPVLWGWGGVRAVLIPWPGDVPCEEYVLAQRHEETLGRLVAC